jgi:hypothetical protein
VGVAIDIAALPSVAFADRLRLPECEAIYFVLNAEGQPLYIGSSIFLKTRWSSHRILKDGPPAGAVRIAWFRCEWREALRLEADLILRLDPVLNVIGRPRRSRPPVHRPIGEFVAAGTITRILDISRALLYRFVSEGRVVEHDVTRPWHQRRHSRFRLAEVMAALDDLGLPSQPQP